MDILRRNNVQVSGTGERVLLLAHGYGCDQGAWADVAPTFQAGWRVVGFDHVGAGGSDLSAYDPAKYASLHGYASDVLEILDALGVDRVTFVGHSMAATVGMLAAIAQPARFDALVMVCPSPRFIDDPPYIGGFSAQDIDELLEVLSANFLGWSRAMAPALMGNPERPELGDGLTSSFCRTDPDIARTWARAVFLADHRADVPACATRTLVLQTRADVVAPIAVGEWMHANLPRSEYRLLDATGHCPHMSAPGQTAAAIRGFVEG